MLRKSLTKLCNLTKCNITGVSCYSVYEPPYFKLYEPEFPIYKTLNIEARGYDFTLLEKYQRYLTSVAKAMALEVSNGWAVPTQNVQVQRFKPQTAVVEGDYKLTLYQRTIQITDIGAPVYPILLRLAQASQPEGVSLTVVEHLDEHEEFRYVPDRELDELKVQLDELGGPITTKKKKK